MVKCINAVENYRMKKRLKKNPERFVVLMFKVIVIHYEISPLSLIKHLWGEQLLKG